MRRFRIGALVCGAVIAQGCVRAGRPAGYDEVVRLARASGPAASTTDDDALAREVTMAEVVRLAVARAPELAERRERVLAELERVRMAGALPDPELGFEAWSVPLARPWAAGDADMLMLGLEQAVPPRGARRARAEAALASARAELAGARAAELDVARRARLAFIDYLLATRELALHGEHLELIHGVASAARTAYEANRATRDDALRAEVAATRLHTDIALVEERLVASRALINALVDRAPDAPLGPPVEPELPGEPDLIALERASAARPELAAAAAQVARAEAERDAAEREGAWPMWMLGASYMYSPAGDHQGYGVMLKITLPWWSERYDAEARAAAHEARAGRAAGEATRRVVRYELSSAAARMEAARKALASLDDELLPQAERAFDSARASFGGASGSALAVMDAFLSFLDARVARARAFARVLEAAAELDRAAGVMP